MKQFVLIVLFALTMSALFGQELEHEQKKLVANFIDCIKYQKKEKLARQTIFPFNREYPIAKIKNSKEFLARYNEVFDDKLTKTIVDSEPSRDWSAVGYRGMMLSNGLVWLDYDGKLIAVNYQSQYEEKMKNELIQLDKSVLHESIKQFENPVHILETTKYRVRIDDLGDGNFRYVSWQLKSNMSEKPEVIIKNGKYKPDGSGGNHVYEFENGEYTYECSIIVLGEKSSPPAYLRIYKREKAILAQKAIILPK